VLSHKIAVTIKMQNKGLGEEVDLHRLQIGNIYAQGTAKYWQSPSPVEIPPTRCKCSPEGNWGKALRLGSSKIARAGCGAENGGIRVCYWGGTVPAMASQKAIDAVSTADEISRWRIRRKVA
jgi:hypothetical protein